MSPQAEDGPPILELRDPEDDEEIDRVLREAQRLIFKYPMATQAIIAALAAEGREFAETGEGRIWRERLMRSELYRRGGEIWYLGTLGMFSGRDSGVLPTAMIEAFVQAVRSRDVSSLVAIFGGRRPRR